MKVRAFIAQWWLGLLLAAIVLAPILLSPRAEKSQGGSEETLVIITPHNEAIRYEFGRGFKEWYRAKHHREVRIDWRSPGGTSEITRYLAGEYFAAFQNHWTNKLGKPWDQVVEKSFANPKVTPGKDPASDTPEQQARRVFLESDVSCRIDLFFGGGAFDYQQQAAIGRLVPSGFVQQHPELFNEKSIPQTLGGEPFWDADGRWIGTCLGAFGICSNLDGLRRVGVENPPTTWKDLADPKFFHSIALANPTQSSSVTKAFEMLIQQEMLAEVNRLPAGASSEEQSAAIAKGWKSALNLLQKIGANARYFTDASTKIALDVAAGEAAAGMTIDFFGRFESEAVRRPDGSSRLQYVDAVGGTSAGADPIGLLRGAPSAEIAKEFIAYVLSPEGQKLWNWKVGTPEGPKRYALRRLPIRPDLYASEFAQFRSDPEVNPYSLAGLFTYHEKWTGPLFKQISFIVRVMCIDAHDELADAWTALVKHGFPSQAAAEFENIEPVNYAAANSRIKEALAGTKIGEVQLAKELADYFRSQYRRAAESARQGH